jgi:cation transport ATPase
MNPQENPEQKLTWPSTKCWLGAVALFLAPIAIYALTGPFFSKETEEKMLITSIALMALLHLPIAILGVWYCWKKHPKTTTTLAVIATPVIAWAIANPSTLHIQILMYLAMAASIILTIQALRALKSNEPEKAP